MHRHLALASSLSALLVLPANAAFAASPWAWTYGAREAGWTEFTIDVHGTDTCGVTVDAAKSRLKVRESGMVVLFVRNLSDESRTVTLSSFLQCNQGDPNKCSTIENPFEQREPQGSDIVRPGERTAIFDNPSSTTTVHPGERSALFGRLAPSVIGDALLRFYVMPGSGCAPVVGEIDVQRSDETPMFLRESLVTGRPYRLTPLR